MPTPHLIADRTARFINAHTPAPPPPFPAYTTQPTPIAPLPLGFPIRPHFHRHRGTTTITFTNAGPAHYYATGEQAGPLLRNSTRKTLWNTDSYDYSDITKSLYQSHPFLLGLAPTTSTRKSRCVPKAFGIIIESTHRITIDLTHPNTPTFEVEGPTPPVTIILRDTPQEVVQALADLTGKIQLPPRWALGYHQCRFSYEPDTQVLELARTFRERNIPCDTLWLDIDYMDGYRCFTFDPKKFPDPAGLIQKLHADNFKVVCMIDPGLKVDDSYSIYTQGRDANHYVRTVTNTEYQGHVWPGPCAFPDFTRQRTRNWFAGLYTDLLNLNIDGFWNDMNEPAIFGTVSKTMPEDNHHDADQDLGGPGPHSRYHNIFGTQMTRATLSALTSHRPTTRPFLLTRAGFLGSQRFAATWTGDNRANEDHYKWSIPMVLNLGLSAQPFSGPDIGGFISDTDPNLFARWMGLGALLPFARGHKNKGTKPHEPWSLGEDCERACRLALQRRYRLLPYLYTLFHEASTTGLPIARPLFFANPTDPKLRTIDDAFLLGNDVLVTTTPIAPRDISSTFINWLPFELTDPHPALPHLYLRPGAILPVGPSMQHTAEKSLDPLTLIINFNDSLAARGTLYEDDGTTTAYQQGAFRLTNFETSASPNAPTQLTTSESGSYAPPPRRIDLLQLQNLNSSFPNPIP